MTLLLDFKPEVKDMAQKMTAADKVEAGVLYSSTPDLPRLRFSGPQYLFLWDHNTERDEWDNYGIEFGTDIRTEAFQAKTELKLMPFLNEAQMISTMKAYLPLGVSWPKQMRDTDATAMLTHTPKQVAGKLVLVGLKAIQAFDNYYCNGLVFDRIRMQIITSATGKKVSAFMYVNKLSSIFKYDPHLQKYKSSHDIQPEPFPIGTLDGEQVFQMPKNWVAGKQAVYA